MEEAAAGRLRLSAEHEATSKAREVVACKEEEEWAEMALPPLLLPPPLLLMQAKLAESERSAIAEWLEAHDTLPVTDVTLKSKFMQSIMARILLPDFAQPQASDAPSAPSSTEAAPSQPLPSSKPAVSPVSVLSNPGEVRGGYGGRGGRGGFDALTGPDARPTGARGPSAPGPERPVGAVGWMQRLDDVW